VCRVDVCAEPGGRTVTVPINDRIAGPFTATGGETVLSYDFRILAATDLAVYRRRGGADVRLTLGTDYTVSGVGAAGGGSITLALGANAADQYLLEGDRPAGRTSDLVYSRALPDSTLNGEFDSLQIQLVELRERLDRALLRSRFDGPAAPILELPPASPDTYLGYDADENLTLFERGEGGGGGESIPDPLPIDKGGTGGNSAAEARENLEIGTLATLDAVGPEFSIGGSTLRFAGILPDMGRLTLTSGTPVTDADVSGVSAAYWTPYTGELVSLWDGAAWRTVEFAETVFYTTVIKPCVTSAGNVVVTGIDDTSSIIVGMVVEGTGIQSGTTIAAILSATSVQLSLPPLSTSSDSRIFKLPASTNVDVCAKLIGGVPVIRFGPLWTNGQTRATALATQDGVKVLAGDPTMRVLGTIRTQATAGLIADSRAQRFVSNLMNPVRRPVEVREATSSWSYAVNAWRVVNGNTGNQIEALFCVPRAAALAAVMVSSGGNVNQPFAAGIGLNTAIADNLTIRVPGFTQVTSIPTQAHAYLEATPGVGYHYFTWLERTFAGLTYTIFGTGAAAGLQPYMQTGMAGVIEA
jgi:hypothetical protein